MSWKQDNNSYEAYWQQASGLHSSQDQSVDNKKHDTKEMRTPPTDPVSDGQMSVALDKDLLDLIDSITQELSRTSTTTTARTATSVSSQGSFFNLDFDNIPNVTDQRFNSYGSQILQPGGISRARSTFSGVGRGSSSFINDVPVIEESPNEDNSPVGYKSQKSAPPDLFSGAVPPVASRPPVYRGPRSPQAIVPTSPSSVPSTASAAAEDPLPQVLHALDDEDDDRIVVVRRITKLGFKSNRTIKAKFTQLGWEVKNVVLLPSRSRSVYPDGGSLSPGSGVNSVSHARPSSMGFVVFKTRQAASDCIKKGTINIEGVDVLVQPFVRQYKPTSPASNSGGVQSST